MLKNKNILITGGGSGIGESLAGLLSIDNKVIICGRSSDKLSRVADANENIAYYVADISVPGEIDRLFKRIADDKIQLDVLINNAGVFEEFDVTVADFSTAQIFEKVNTNLSAPVAITQWFIGQADRAVQNYIINITAELALFPVPIWALYSASKTGFSVFTRLLRQQVKGSSFRVVEILPPAIDTPMSRSGDNGRPLPSPADFAMNVIRAVNRGKAEYAPGANAPLLKFFSRFAPRLGLKIVDKATRKLSRKG